MWKVHAKALALIATLFIVIDVTYLRLIFNYWNTQVSRIQGSPLVVDKLPAVLAYGLLVIGLYYFIIKDNRPWWDAVLLGWFVYFVFDLTNKGLFTNWTWTTVILDGLWGGVLFGLITYIYYKLAPKLIRN